MTDEQRLTLEELAGAVGMTTRNVRAYQTRGLLQPPRRAGRMSVYTTEHVERLRQVQRARARGASLQLLRTLISEGRDLEGVWQGGDPPGPASIVDVRDRDRAGGHTAACLAHLDLPLDPVLADLGHAGDAGVPPAVRELVDAGVLTGRPDGVRAPAAFGCAVIGLHDQGLLGSALEALRMTRAVAGAAETVATALAEAVRAADADLRRAAATRLGELAGAVVAELVAARLGTRDESRVP